MCSYVRGLLFLVIVMLSVPGIESEDKIQRLKFPGNRIEVKCSKSFLLACVFSCVPSMAQFLKVNHDEKTVQKRKQKLLCNMLNKS